MLLVKKEIGQEENTTKYLLEILKLEIMDKNLNDFYVTLSLVEKWNK